MNIGIWGDSIVYGVGDEEALGWAGRLRKSIDEDNYFGVYSRGVNGDTTEDLLKRLDTEMSSVEPNILLLAIGINDSKFINNSTETRIPFEDFKENINTILIKSKAQSQKVVFIGLTKIKEDIANGRGSTSTFTNGSSKKYDIYLQEFTAKENVPYINMWDVLDIESDLSDGLHPNSKGYQKMFEHIHDFLVKEGVIKSKT